MESHRRNLRSGRTAWIAAAAVSFLGGCQATPKSGGGYVFFPAPPEAPRVQFLTWASGAQEVEPSRGSFESFVLGDEPIVEHSINKPYGVAVHDGVVYVCDTKGLSLCRLDFKIQKYSVLGVNGPGRLRKPINLVIDPLGYKFVVDVDRKQVVVFGPDDGYVTAFDVPPPCHPVDVAVYENELYVLDNDDTCQIVVMDRTSGNVLRTFGGPGGGPGQFKIPNSLAVSPDGFVYVSDTHNWRIQKLTREGGSVWVKGAPGYRLGQFGRPRGIRVAADGTVYVVDGATEIVQMFDPDGNTLMRFGGPGDVPGTLGLPSTLAIDSASNSYFKQFVHPDFRVDYLLFVISQFGQRLVNVYAFGSFPPGYKLAESQVATLPVIPVEEGIKPVGEGPRPPEPSGRPPEESPDD